MHDKAVRRGLSLRFSRNDFTLGNWVVNNLFLFYDIIFIALSLRKFNVSFIILSIQEYNLADSPKLMFSKYF